MNEAEVASSAAPPVKPRWRGGSHEIAAFVFPVLGVVLVALADTTSARWAAVIYSVGVTAMYATSACYHRGHWSPSVRQRLRRLDHSMILVGIAATYTPIAVVGLDTRSARVLLGVVWPLALVGIVVQLFWLDAPRWLVAALYVVIGWTALAFIPVLWHELGVITFSLIVAGGVVYSVGARVYSSRRPDPVPAVFGFHEVFHALVIAAGLIFYIAIARVIVTATGTTTKPSTAAAQRYSAIATVGNRGLEVLDHLEERDRNDLVAARTDLRDAAATERRFDRSLLGIALPRAIETTALALVRVNESRATLTTDAAASTSLAQLHRYEPQLSAANAKVEREVKALRSQLGLPPPETS